MAIIKALIAVSHCFLIIVNDRLPKIIFYIFFAYISVHFPKVRQDSDKPSPHRTKFVAIPSSCSGKPYFSFPRAMLFIKKAIFLARVLMVCRPSKYSPYREALKISAISFSKRGAQASSSPSFSATCFAISSILFSSIPTSLRCIGMLMDSKNL